MLIKNFKRSLGSIALQQERTTALQRSLVLHWHKPLPCYLKFYAHTGPQELQEEGGRLPDRFIPLTTSSLLTLKTLRKFTTSKAYCQFILTKQICGQQLGFPQSKLIMLYNPCEGHKTSHYTLKKKIKLLPEDLEGQTCLCSLFFLN